MLNPNFNAFNKIGDLVSASLQKLSNISKPRFKFFSTVFELWLALPVRYTMLNLGRLGAYSEKSIRLHFENLFDFVSFNVALIKKSCTKELMHLKRIGDQLPLYSRYSSGNSHVTGSGTNTIQRSITGKEAKPGKPLCEPHNKADAYTKANGKIPGGRWLFYEA